MRQAGPLAQREHRVPGDPVGVVTSGGFGPTVDAPIAMALVDPAVAEIGTELVADVRGKDEAVTVEVLENLYRMANWKLEGVSHEWDKENSNRIRFDIQVPSEGETVITYTAHYTW